MPVGEGQVETVAHDGSGGGDSSSSSSSRLEVLGRAGKVTVAGADLVPPSRCEHAGQSVLMQPQINCRNNRRRWRVRARCPLSGGNYLVCPVYMDLQYSILT